MAGVDAPWAEKREPEKYAYPGPKETFTGIHSLSETAGKEPEKRERNRHRRTEKTFVKISVKSVEIHEDTKNAFA